MKTLARLAKIIPLIIFPGILACNNALFSEAAGQKPKAKKPSALPARAADEEATDPRGLTYEDELERELEMISSSVQDETFVLEGYEFTELQSSHEDFISEITGERPHLLGMTVGEVVDMVTFGSLPLYHKVNFIDVIQAADRFMTGGTAEEMGYELQTANSNKPKCNGDSSISNKGCPNKISDPESPEAIQRKCEDSLTTLDNTEAWLASNVWNRKPSQKPKAKLLQDEDADDAYADDDDSETLGDVAGAEDVPTYKKAEEVVYMRRNQAINYRAKNCL